MGYFYEEKALGGSSTRENMDSLEQDLTLFLGEDLSNKHDCSLEDYESDDSEFLQSSAERSLYWESQYALLQEILERYSLSGSKFRQEISRIIEQARDSNFCNCLKPTTEGCFPCLRRNVVSLLCDKGYNAVLRTSKWSSTRKFPGGSHEYIEVLASSSNRKKEIAVLVELEVRDQFQIAKACDEYKELIAQLPEIFIGKINYLSAIVRLVCEAAKESMRKKKIHMGPWRKTGFVQMKWSGLNQTLELEECFAKTSPLANNKPAVGGPCLQVSAVPAVLVS